MMDPLQELYPFLHGQAKNPQREKTALLESVRQKSAESRNVKAQFFAAHAEALVSMAAYRKARETGMVTFGLAGMQGGEMQASGLVDHLLVVATDSIHRIQECHVTTFHILWDLVHTILADRRGDLRAEVTEDALRG